MEKPNRETTVLILINSKNGSTVRLATEIAAGVEKEHVRAVIKKVPTIDAKDAELFKEIPVATIDELPGYDGIAFGSPIHFGNMSADMRHFLDQGIKIWVDQSLAGVPATVFMAGGSGLGRESAILSFWNNLASQGMTLVTTGNIGATAAGARALNGNTPFGITTIAGREPKNTLSEAEVDIAREQGAALARAARALSSERPHSKKSASVPAPPKRRTIDTSALGLPKAPKPVGNYRAAVRSGNLVFINQIALKDGKVLYPGVIGKDVSLEQAKEATKQTMQNVLAVLADALDGDLNRVERCVQLTGIFNTPSGFAEHAQVMNAASDYVVEVLGDAGPHARGTLGAASLPLNSAVEIQAIFEVR